jgi:hypothetical protein
LGTSGFQTKPNQIACLSLSDLLEIGHLRFWKKMKLHVGFDGNCTWRGFNKSEIACWMWWKLKLKCNLYFGMLTCSTPSNPTCNFAIVLLAKPTRRDFCVSPRQGWGKIENI